ncbi:MAG TPA: hypothetical protein DD653_10150 [Marinilabiliales bacterium]|nr:hypothetical protein [Marinilabiliales bacterium]HCC28978.1 hypothetical protein [Marinilabiliales bacterium]
MTTTEWCHPGRSEAETRELLNEKDEVNNKKIPHQVRDDNDTMKNKRLIPILILLAALTACHRSFTKEELMAYVNNPKNGLVQEKEINGTRLKLTYKPYQLLAWQEMQAVDTLTPEKEKEILSRYSQQHYFVLSISQGGKEILSNAADRQRFSQMVSQFAFGMGQTVTLTTAEQDTLPLLDFIYPRMYGMAPSTDILFAFTREKTKTEYLTFYLDEFGLRTGETRFVILNREMNKLKYVNLIPK